MGKQMRIRANKHQKKRTRMADAEADACAVPQQSADAAGIDDTLLASSSSSVVSAVKSSTTAQSHYRLPADIDALFPLLTAGSASSTQKGMAAVGIASVLADDHAQGRLGAARQVLGDTRLAAMQMLLADPDVDVLAAGLSLIAAAMDWLAHAQDGDALMPAMVARFLPTVVQCGASDTAKRLARAVTKMSLSTASSSMIRDYFTAMERLLSAYQALAVDCRVDGAALQEIVVMALASVDAACAGMMVKVEPAATEPAAMEQVHENNAAAALDGGEETVKAEDVAADRRSALVEALEPTLAFIYRVMAVAGSALTANTNAAVTTSTLNVLSMQGAQVSLQCHAAGSLLHCAMVHGSDALMSAPAWLALQHWISIGDAADVRCALEIVDDLLEACASPDVAGWMREDEDDDEEAAHPEASAASAALFHAIHHFELVPRAMRNNHLDATAYRMLLSLVHTIYLECPPSSAAESLSTFRWLSAALVQRAEDHALAEPILTCMWTVGQALIDSDDAVVDALEDDASVAGLVSTLQKIYEQSGDMDSRRTAVIGAATVLINLLHQSPSIGHHLLLSTAVGPSLSHLLRTIFDHEPRADCLAEAANALLDLYGPDLLNDVFPASGWLSYLVAQEKRLRGALCGHGAGVKRRRCREMWDNLVRFVEYKQQG